MVLFFEGFDDAGCQQVCAELGEEDAQVVSGEHQVKVVRLAVPRAQPHHQQLACTLRRKEGNILFNDALNTFYLRLYGIRHTVKDHSNSERGNPLLPHGYSFRLAARVLLYASSHRQDSTYHSLCYISRGALDGTRNSSMGPPHEESIR